MRWITFGLLLSAVLGCGAAPETEQSTDGKVRWIHSGFSGPGTGRHHEELVEEMERRIEVLLAER